MASGAAADYQKPGASVRLHHDYDGSSVPGEAESVRLQFSHSYSEGLLRVSLQPEEGLQLLSGEGPYEFPLAAQSNPEAQVSVVAEVPGRYHLKIFADVLLPDGGIERRVLGLAFDFGEPAAGLRPSTGENKTGFRGENLRVLPAQENVAPEE